MKTPGIHHVTAISSDAQANIDFYTGILGLRLVKQTVNFDDPSAYHLYYGNKSGSPGTILTFFVWPDSAAGRRGVGQITALAFGVPLNSLSFWKKRLDNNSILYEERKRFDGKYLALQDPDGIELEIVEEYQQADTLPWTAVIPAEYVIHGFHSVTLSEDGSERTREFLSDSFGYMQDGETENIFRYSTERDTLGRHLYVRVAPDLPQGIMGAGTIHHVAFRAKSNLEELDMRKELLKIGMDATPVIDRMYFNSVYFREPGGILFEIATDEPGFIIDESLENLGTSLRLPPQYEPYREKIEQVLPGLHLLI